MAILKQNEEGTSVVDLHQKHGASIVGLYQWRAKFNEMDASMMKRMKELETKKSSTDKTPLYKN